ncbi:MAG: SnoaL-like domain, partial [Gaiellales bacterium]|nr:SnoaL-like domain [Gaiellales bacterium]
MQREDVRSLIARHDEAWNNQDLDAIMACYTPDIVFTNYNAGESASGAAAVREHLAGIFAGWPDLRFSGRRLNVSEEFAVSDVVAHGSTMRYRGILGQVRPTPTRILQRSNRERPSK